MSCFNKIISFAVLLFSQLDSHGSMSPSTTTQVQARKRRRGVRELIIFGAKLRTADPNVSLPPVTYITLCLFPIDRLLRNGDVTESIAVCQS